MGGTASSLEPLKLLMPWPAAGSSLQGIQKVAHLWVDHSPPLAQPRCVSLGTSGPSGILMGFPAAEGTSVREDGRRDWGPFCCSSAWG